jgi:hypothetical protein
MEMRRGEGLGPDVAWYGVSRPPFIGQARERRGHGRVGTAYNERTAK